ncbi:DUF3570 domain-containing protein [Pleionea sediminis]|uniref:DUF3570 domain-containing protein n=1 Tax=Pleionea sediminis TaxID=2569479 RepID=UPI0013DE1836|nr:DUF3570 domain-containing protein [Pleionea sediminis]
MAVTKENQALLAFTTAASALMSAHSSADQISQDVQFGFRYHLYSEDSADKSLLFNAEKDRYEIKVNQFQLIVPVSGYVEFEVNAQHETMSGASPWFTFPDVDGEIVQVMSGASIEDTRTDGSLGIKYVDGQHSLGTTLATSTEDDYDSVSFALSYSFDTEDKMSTHTLSIDASDDEIAPTLTNDTFNTRITEPEEKQSSSILYSYTPIINKNMLMKFNLGYATKSGFLSDPYKVVSIGSSGSNIIADSRPDKRIATTAAFQIRYFSDALDGAFHFDYRLYDDDWEIRSNTLKVAWYQNITESLQLVPSIRLYDQTSAYFYQIFYEQARDDQFHSTDYRLSEYGAVTYGLKLNKAFKDWSFTISAEQYQSGADIGLAKAEEANPGLLNFNLVSVGFNLTF